MSRLTRLWYFSSSVNSFFKRTCPAIQWSYTVDVWFLVRPFVYFHISCMRTAKALAKLRRCAGLPEPSLVAYARSTIISWAGSYKNLSWLFGMDKNIHCTGHFSASVDLPNDAEQWSRGTDFSSLHQNSHEKFLSLHIPSFQIIHLQFVSIIIYVRFESLLMKY